MPEPAHYLIHHPDQGRERVRVQAAALDAGKLNPAWSGHIWIDKPGSCQNPCDNEDPFVLTAEESLRDAPWWLYSYCHATQLRRSVRQGAYVQPDSVLIFCSKKEGALLVDTVFVVGQRLEWECIGKKVPAEYSWAQGEDKSELWKRHFRCGVMRSEGLLAAHRGEITYRASMQSEDPDNYSMIPIGWDKNRIELHVEALKSSLANEINDKIIVPVRTHPVQLNEHELQLILTSIREAATIQVVGPIIRLSFRSIECS